MIDVDRWQEIWMTLSKNKLRTFLTAFGVGWGVLMLVIMLGAGAGLQNGVSREFSGMAANSVFLWSQSTSMPYKGFKKGRYFSFNNGDTEAILNTIPEVEHLSPGLQLGGWRGANNVKYGDKVAAFEINGYLPVAKDIKLLNMLSGRFLNDLDVDENRKVCVIGKRVTEVFFDTDENPIGKYIQAQGVYFRIVGTFASARSGENADGENQSIYIPFTTFQKVFNMGDQVQWFVVTSKPDVPASVVDEKVRTLLKRRHHVHPDDLRGVGGFNAEEEFQEVQAVFTGINVLSWFVGVFTLLAGVIGISNIMLVIIKERTREIGVRRSIGATPYAIISQIMLESVVLTFVSGAIGFMIGVALVEGLGGFIEDDAFTNPEIDFGIALSALIILVISGMLAGLMPASRAVQIRPVDALRSE
jgi:putative ABC transport system permease protein